MTLLRRSNTLPVAGTLTAVVALQTISWYTGEPGPILDTPITQLLYTATVVAWSAHMIVHCRDQLALRNYREATRRINRARKATAESHPPPARRLRRVS